MLRFIRATMLYVARMKRSEIREAIIALGFPPHCAALHTGYDAALHTGYDAEFNHGRLPAPLYVARMKRSEIREAIIALGFPPHCAALHTGYDAALHTGYDALCSPDETK